MTLEPGEKLILEAYIWTGVPYWPNYAAANVQDVALELFKPEPPQIADEVELRTAGIAYARTLMTDFDSGRLLIIGLSPKGDGFARNDHFEIGWCGAERVICAHDAQRISANWRKGIVRRCDKCTGYLAKGASAKWIDVRTLRKAVYR